MKSFKKTKPKNTTILQQQSNKLKCQKQKLQLLKQQVTQKKQQKQMNKTATSLQQQKQSQQNRTLQFNTKNNTQYSNFTTNNDNKLMNALNEMKVQNIQLKLKEKGIKNYQNLIQLTEQEIDQWKDIVLGHRIKIKKYLKNNKSSVSNLESNSTQNQNIQQEKGQSCISMKLQEKIEQKQRNIEDIIKQRQISKIFIPLQRQYDQQNDQNSQQIQQITDQDQDIIIQSFMDIFQPRQGILKPSLREMGKYKNRKIIWSKQVDKMQKQFKVKNHKKYPKQSIAKQALLAVNIGSQQSIPQSQNSTVQNFKYCWKCFRKIELKQNICFRICKQEKGKYFCSKKCETLYNEQMQIFTQKVQISLLNIQSKKENSKFIEQNQEDLQLIDLQIC